MIFAKIFALASVFSILLSYFSLISSLQLKLHLSANGLSYNCVDKNFMFLLCIGILGLIVKKSCLTEESSKDTEHGREIKAVEEEENEGRTMRLGSEGRSSIEEKVGKEVEGAQETENTSSNGEAGREEDVLLIVQRCQSEGEGEEEGYETVTKEGHDSVVVEDDDDDNDDDENDDEDDGNGLLRTEELNKKCEDFIRRMRHGIRLEASKLIMLEA